MTKLGEGSYGSVFLVRHRNSQAQFALKVIKKSKLSVSRVAQNQGNYGEVQIQRECTQHQLSNVIEMIESFEDEHHVYIVMKHLLGGNMYQYL